MKIHRVCARWAVIGAILWGVFQSLDVDMARDRGGSMLALGFAWAPLILAIWYLRWALTFKPFVEADSPNARTIDDDFVRFKFDPDSERFSLVVKRARWTDGPDREWRQGRLEILRDLRDASIELGSSNAWETKSYRETAIGTIAGPGGLSTMVVHGPKREYTVKSDDMVLSFNITEFRGGGVLWIEVDRSVTPMGHRVFRDCWDPIAKEMNGRRLKARAPTALSAFEVGEEPDESHE